ncbi:helix-turn-helix domain-containing protein [Bacteroides sp. GD17]|jgi:AraC family transcriptional activator of pobA|uniref:AraC family transcriptional regulator n=1 Tax=Bacteroides sp. GD17 TaxID=3139826 RepID=UPI0025EF5362|nr:AraC family transcriptional regulator [uncultured Bacteroides sp.]
MKSTIPQYTFYKTKYGSELLIDVVELSYTRKFLTESSIHTLTYYDITFITEGKGTFSIDNQTQEAVPGDVFFTKPGEIRNWDTAHISNGYALIFEDEFLSSFFKDPLFVQHLPYFNIGKTAHKLHLPDTLYPRMLQLLCEIKTEIDTYRQNDVHVLRALLYEALMLLNRAYLHAATPQKTDRETGNNHLNRFIQLVNAHLKEHHSVQYYADKLCITPNYLNEIVNSSLNMNAKQYIRNKVMDEAKRLLAYTDLPISEIAFELNFSTVSYFVRSFRQYTRETPLSYRQVHKP